MIRRQLIDHIDLPNERLHSPRVHAPDIAASCDRYDRTVVELGVDVQLLGIGGDGHIGFNEPGSSLASRTRVKTLTEQPAATTPGSSAPSTMSLGTSSPRGSARSATPQHLVMIAAGDSKAEPVAAMVEGPVSASCPASVLQFHRHVTVLLDEAAASGLRHGGYYRETYLHKPSWQHL